MTHEGSTLPIDLYSALQIACDPLAVSISIADPDHHDMPLIYVNPAFEQLTQYAARDVIGRNCRFLQGAFTDRAVTLELAYACDRKTEDSCCLINYRKDGSLFFNLLDIRPIHVSHNRTLMMGCQFAFTPTQTAGSLAQTNAMIDRAQRRVRLNKHASDEAINVHDIYRLDTVAMRFEAAFTRVKNVLIKSGNDRMFAEFRRQRAAADRQYESCRKPRLTEPPATAMESAI